MFVIEVNMADRFLKEMRGRQSVYLWKAVLQMLAGGGGRIQFESFHSKLAKELPTALCD